MVPHSWLLRIMDDTKIAGNLSRLIKDSMGMWETELCCNGESLGNVEIKRGIFQGDSLSPLLFIMAMVPLTALLNAEKFGYRFKDPPLVEFNHLFFMDDLKLYAKTERELEELLKIVYKFSKDIGMEFGFEKCGLLIMKKGLKVKSDGIKLPCGEKIKEVDNHGYKYLGVLQECNVLHTEMKEKVKNEYLRRVKAVARSKLYSRNLFTAINSYAVSVVRYSAGILDWQEKELKDIDIKTRKILTMNGVFHKKGNVNRLYLKRNDGGRGLISVEDCVKIEQLNLSNYLRLSEEALLQAANRVFNVEIPSNESVFESTESTEGEGECEVAVRESEVSVKETGDAYKERVANERLEDFGNKPMHGKWARDNKDMSMRTFDWVTKGFVSKRTEGFIFAAQEQALQTNWLKSRILGGDFDNRCRKCKGFPETVSHLVSGCPNLAQLEFKTRHDRVGLRVYWELCRKFNIRCSDRWFKETPDKIRTSKCGRYEIWWDRAVETSKALEHNRPDLVLIDNVKKHWIIVDFSVPNDKNVELKEKEKVDHYNALAYEIRKIKKVTTQILPLVVGALGRVTTNLEKNLSLLEIAHVQICMQVTAIIGSGIILKKVLNV